MKATCDQDDLIKSVQTVSRAMPSRSPMEILEGIYVKAANNTLQLRCTDTVMSIEDNLPAMVTEEGEIVLPGRLFSEIVRKLPVGAVSIQVKGTLVNIACGASKMTLQGLDAQAFPSLPVLENAKPLLIKTSELKNLIHQTNFATAVDETQPILMGELMEIEQNSVTMVALDGYRMAIATLPLEHEAVPMRAVLPGKALNEMEKLFDDTNQEAKITFGSTQAAVEMGQTIIVTRLLEGDFINYRQILPQTKQTRIGIKTLLLADAVERASLLAREGKNNLIKIEIKESGVIVSANGERGNTTEEIEVTTMEGKALAIAFNAKYLLDVLRVIKDEEILMDFISDRSPCVVSPTVGKAYQFIVLPVRIQS